MDDDPDDILQEAMSLTRVLDQIAADAQELRTAISPLADADHAVWAAAAAHQHRRRSSELQRAVIAAHERARVLLDKARVVTDEVLCDRIERREWPPCPRTSSDRGAARSATSRQAPTGRAQGHEHGAVARAAVFITVHAAEPVTIDDIARASQIGPRQLQNLFQKEYRTSPMNFLRQVRLDGAHRELQRADSTCGDRVESIARGWMFGNLGRFATMYRQRFGCFPSETLRALPCVD